MDHFGLVPDLVAGHSFGELVALHAAGVFGAETLLDLAGRRGLLMGHLQKTNPGTMLAIFADSHSVQKQIDLHRLPLVIANHNAPTQVVVSGTEAQIDQLKTQQ